MNVGFFEFNQNPWHLALSFEIAQIELEKGNNVFYYFLGHTVKENQRHIYYRKFARLQTCLLPEYRVGKKLKKLHPGKFHFSDQYPGSVIDYTRSENLMLLAQEAAKNELVDELHDSVPAFSLHEENLKNKSNAYFETFYLTKKEIIRNNLELIYTYNGRFLHEAAVWESCRSLEVPCNFHEKFEPIWGDRYWIFKDGVHNSKERAIVINNFWDSSKYSYSDKIDFANSWLDKRRKGISQPYTKSQIPGKLEESTPPKYVLFMHSSDDELIASGLGVSKVWGRQEIAIKRIEAILNSRTDLELIVRVHPNLLTRSLEEQMRWQKIFSQLNCKVINAGDSVDTYAMIEKAVCVISFGSTAGVEASLLGVPSILIGPALHADLHATINIDSESEFLSVLGKALKKELDFEANIIQAVKYAFFYEKGGEQMRFNILIGDPRTQDPPLKVVGVVLKSSAILSKAYSLLSRFRRIHSEI